VRKIQFFKKNVKKTTITKTFKCEKLKKYPSNQLGTIVTYLAKKRNHLKKIFDNYSIRICNGYVVFSFFVDNQLVDQSYFFMDGVVNK
jgi:ubiquinone biosynthesis protein Coq4